MKTTTSFNNTDDILTYILGNYETAPKFTFSSNEIKDIFENKESANPKTVKKYMEYILNRIEMIHAPKSEFAIGNFTYDTLRTFYKIDAELEVGVEYPTYELDNITIAENYKINPYYSVSCGGLYDYETYKKIYNFDYLIPLRAFLIAYGKLPKSSFDDTINRQANTIRRIMTISDMDTILTYGKVGIPSYLCHPEIYRPRAATKIDWYTHWGIKVVEGCLTGEAFLKFSSIVNDLIAGKSTNVMEYINNHYM